MTGVRVIRLGRPEEGRLFFMDCPSCLFVKMNQMRMVCVKWVSSKYCMAAWQNRVRVW